MSLGMPYVLPQICPFPFFWSVFSFLFSSQWQASNPSLRSSPKNSPVSVCQHLAQRTGALSERGVKPPAPLLVLSEHLFLFSVYSYEQSGKRLDEGRSHSSVILSLLRAFNLFLYPPPAPNNLPHSTWFSCPYCLSQPSPVLVFLIPQDPVLDSCQPSYLFPCLRPPALDQCLTCLRTSFFSIPAADVRSHHH